MKRWSSTSQDGNLFKYFFSLNVLSYNLSLLQKVESGGALVASPLIRHCPAPIYASVPNAKILNGTGGKFLTRVVKYVAKLLAIQWRMAVPTRVLCCVILDLVLIAQPRHSVNVDAGKCHSR